jgi:putative transcriptional regulator
VNSLAGHLLVASPHLADPNFARTVVLMIHHTDEGAFGVVLNRPAENTVKDLWAQVDQSHCATSQHVHVGGPVSGPLMAIHTDEQHSELEILPGLYFAAQRDHLEKLVAHDRRELRLFVGHSGWGGGQLESELKQGSWYTLPATIDHVFYDEPDLWKQVTQQIGEKMLTSMLKLKNVPKDVADN